MSITSDYFSGTESPRSLILPQHPTDRRFPKSWQEQIFGGAAYGSLNVGSAFLRRVGRAIPGEDPIEAAGNWVEDYKNRNSHLAPERVESARALLANPKALAGVVAESTPYSAASLGTMGVGAGVGAVFAGPVGAAVGGAIGAAGPFLLAFAVEGQNSYDEAIREGATEHEAAVTGNIVGAINGLIEVSQVGRVLRFGRGGREALTRQALKNARKFMAQRPTVRFTRESLGLVAKEGLQEALQGTVGEGVALQVYRGGPLADGGFNKEFWDRRFQEAIGGGVSAFAFGSAVRGASALKKDYRDTIGDVDSSERKVNRSQIKRIMIEQFKIPTEKAELELRLFDAFARQIEEDRGWQPGQAYDEFFANTEKDMESIGESFLRGTLFQDADAIKGFFTKSQRLLESDAFKGQMGKKLTANASDIIAQLRGVNSPKISADEYMWTGLRGLLESKEESGENVTHQELLDVVTKSGIQVDAAIKGRDNPEQARAKEAATDDLSGSIETMGEIKGKWEKTQAKIDTGKAMLAHNARRQQQLQRDIYQIEQEIRGNGLSTTPSRDAIVQLRGRLEGLISELEELQSEEATGVTEDIQQDIEKAEKESRKLREMYYVADARTERLQGRLNTIQERHVQEGGVLDFADTGRIRDPHGLETGQGEGTNYREILLRVPNLGSIPAKGAKDIPPHKVHYWPENNTIVHLRLSTRERVLQKGSRPVKTLFLEEVQSDVHQEARESRADRRKYFTALFEETEGSFLDEKDKRVRLDKYLEDNMPPAPPFETKYNEFAIKYAILYALETGHEGIQIATAEENRIANEPLIQEEGRAQLYGQILPKALSEVAKKNLGSKADRHSLFFNSKIRKAIAEKGISLFQGPRGAVTFLHKDGKAIMKAFESANLTTALHELFHVMRRHLPPDIKGILEEEFKVEGGVWTTANEEDAALAFESYLSRGIAPSQELVDSFRAIAKDFESVYPTVKGSPREIKVSLRVEEAFDLMLAPDTAEIKEKRAQIRSASKRLLDISPKEVHKPVDPVVDEEISDRAYAIWEKRGKPEHVQDEIWSQAVAELRVEHAEAAIKAPSTLYQGGDRYTALSDTEVQSRYWEATDKLWDYGTPSEIALRQQLKLLVQKEKQGYIEGLAPLSAILEYREIATEHSRRQSRAYPRKITLYRAGKPGPTSSKRGVYYADSEEAVQGILQWDSLFKSLEKKNPQEFKTKEHLQEMRDPIVFKSLGVAADVLLGHEAFHFYDDVAADQEVIDLEEDLERQGVATESKEYQEQLGLAEEKFSKRVFELESRVAQEAKRRGHDFLIFKDRWDNTYQEIIDLGPVEVPPWSPDTESRRHPKERAWWAKGSAQLHREWSKKYGVMPRRGEELELPLAMKGLKLTKDQQALWNELSPLLNKQSGGMPKLVIEPLVPRANDPPATGAYSSANHRITLSPYNPPWDVARTLLHEASHAATHKVVEIGYERITDTAEADSRFSSTERDAYDRLDEILERLKKLSAKQQEPIYGLTDIGELISEAFSNPEFQAFLGGIRLTDEAAFAGLRNQNLFESFKTAVKELLGISSGGAATALDEVIGLSATIATSDIVISDILPSHEHKVYRAGEVIPEYFHHYGSTRESATKAATKEGVTRPISEAIISIENPIRMEDSGRAHENPVFLIEDILAADMELPVKDRKFLEREHRDLPGVIKKSVQVRGVKGGFDDLKEFFTRKNIDGIIYENKNEDPGSTGYIIWKDTLYQRDSTQYRTDTSPEAALESNKETRELIEKLTNELISLKQKHVTGLIPSIEKAEQFTAEYYESETPKDRSLRNSVFDVVGAFPRWVVSMAYTVNTTKGGSKALELWDNVYQFMRSAKGEQAVDIQRVFTNLSFSDRRWIARVERDGRGYTNGQRLIEQTGVPKDLRIKAHNAQIEDYRRRVIENQRVAGVLAAESGMSRRTDRGVVEPFEPSKKAKHPRLGTDDLYRIVSEGGPNLNELAKVLAKENTLAQGQKNVIRIKKALQEEFGNPTTRKSGMLEEVRKITNFPAEAVINGKKVRFFHTTPNYVMTKGLDLQLMRIAVVNNFGQPNLVPPGTLKDLGEFYRILAPKKKLQLVEEDLRDRLITHGVDAATEAKTMKDLKKLAGAFEVSSVITGEEIIEAISEINPMELSATQKREVLTFAKRLKGIDLTQTPTDLYAAVFRRLQEPTIDVLAQLKAMHVAEAQRPDAGLEFDEISRAAQGIPLQRDVYRSKLMRALFAASNLIGVSQTMFSVLPNISQPLALIPRFVGYKRFLAASYAQMANPEMTKAQMAGLGAFEYTSFDIAWEKGYRLESIGRLIRQSVAGMTGLRYIAEKNNIIAAKAFHLMAQDWALHGIKKGDIHVAKTLRLTEKEIEEGRKGKVSQATIDKVVQNGVASTQFVTEAPYRKAKIENIPLGRVIFAYSNYTLGQTRALVATFAQIGSELKGGRPDRAFLTFMRGTTGLVGAGIMGGILRDALKGDLGDRDDETLLDAALGGAVEVQLLGAAQRMIMPFKYDRGITEMALLGSMAHIKVLSELLSVIIKRGRLANFTFTEHLKKVAEKNNPVMRATGEWIDMAAFPAYLDYWEAKRAVGRFRKEILKRKKDLGIYILNPEYLKIQEAVAKNDIDGAREEFGKWIVPKLLKGEALDDLLRNVRASLRSRRPMNLNSDDQLRFLHWQKPSERKMTFEAELRYMRLVNLLTGGP